MRPSVGCGSGAECGKQNPELAEDRVGIRGRVWIRWPRRAPGSGTDSEGGWSSRSGRIIDRVWNSRAGSPDGSMVTGSLKVSVCGGSGWWWRSCAGPVSTTGLVVRRLVEVSEPRLVVNIVSVSLSGVGHASNAIIWRMVSSSMIFRLALHVDVADM